MLLTSLGILLAVACGSPGNLAPNPARSFDIDPIFREFYVTLGGETVLGEALTAVVEREGRRCQYVEAALMCLSPAEAGSTRYQLEPVGHLMQAFDDPLYSPPPNSGSQILAGGYVLFDDFAPLYERLYGDIYVGKPLTNVRLDYENGRYVQFFENVGFFRKFSDPPGQAHLLPYGAYTCQPDCARGLDEYWAMAPMGRISQPFELTLQRLNLDGLGRPLTQPKATEDGAIEQVYDNAVLFASADNLAEIGLRPVTLWLGQTAIQPAVERNPHEQLVFYETENGLGHNVPLFFDRFISNHGGRSLSGDPITELFVVAEDQQYRQCFTNYCLDYFPTAGNGQTVRLADLGAQYVTSREPGRMARRVFTAETVEVQLSEAYGQIGAQERQQLNLRVLERRTGLPMPLVPGRFTVFLPDGEPIDVVFPPTNEAGESSALLEPLGRLPALTVVEYQACLDLPGEREAPPVCAVDSFVYLEQ